MLAGAFATFLLVILIVTDWFHFTRLSAPGGRYGFAVSRKEDWLPAPVTPVGHSCFDAHGILSLPHGIARLFRSERCIVLRPQYHLFSMRFRTAWPLKATIELGDGDSTRILCVKRMPWSSALLTGIWFTVVALGTLGFLAMFLVQGGFASLGGVLMGLGITGLGLLVFAFGLLIVALAYRLEDERLTQAYEELRQALAPGPATTGQTTAGHHGGRR